MIVLAFILSGLALLVFQLTAAPFHEISLEDLGLIGAGRVGPDFVFLAVLLAGLHERPRRALWIAVLLGAAVDWASVDPWGVRTVGYTTGAWIAARLARRGWAEPFTARTAAIAASAAALEGVRLLFLWALRLEGVMPAAWSSAAAVLYETAWGAAAVPILQAARGSGDAEAWGARERAGARS